MIGFAGAHRTGKTTLAKEFADRYDCEYLETSVSSVFEEMGLDPAVTYDFATRLRVQRAILKHLDRVYGQAEDDVNTVTDRTPLDLLLYTYADVQNDNLTDEDAAALAQYTADCIECLNRRFTMVMIVQPGIPIVPAPGKASLNTAYIEHLNLLALGLMNDERIETRVAYIPRAMTDLDERTDATFDTLTRFIERSEQNLLSELERGNHIH